jgi:ankyrin repeat protein
LSLYFHNHSLSHSIIPSLQYPTAATIPNAKGKIPLHYAAREGRLPVVRFFLSACPQTASIASCKQKLALHFAAGDGHAAVVRDLLTVHPEGASFPSSKGKLPLHFAARWGHLQIAHDLQLCFKDGVQTRDWEGSLPLHDAAREGQYLTARYLLECHPNALSAQNLRGELPLFPAVRSGNRDLIALLALAWPEGGAHVLSNLSKEDRVTEQEDVLDLLLRAAVRNFADCPLLVGREPPTVCLSENGKSEDYNNVAEDTTAPPRCKSPILLDMDGTERKKRSMSESGCERKRLCVRKNMKPRPFYPLHAAFRAKASCHVLKTVLKRNQKDLDQRDEMGRLPIHWAMKYCQEDDVVALVSKELITPESASARDGQNQLPLHIAVASCADVRVVAALLEAYPAAGVERCRSNDLWFDKMPLDMAVHYDCELCTIYQLLRVDPSFVQR